MKQNRPKLVGAITIVLAVAVWFLLLVPEHFLRRFSGGCNVTIDDQPADAVSYIGNPTTNEADAYLLVRIPREGNYIFNFDDGTYCKVSSYEFLPLHWAVFIFKPVSKGPWLASLHDENLDEFRIAANGHTVTVKLGR